MSLKLPTAAALTLGAAFALAMPGIAADLPQSGTIKTHGIHKGTFQGFQVGEKHSMGVGMLRTTILGAAPFIGALRCAQSLSMM